MKMITTLMKQLYEEAYIQGRQDGFEGLHIDLKVVLEANLNDSIISEKLSKLELNALNLIQH